MIRLKTIRRKVRELLVGPQLLAFLPALTLSGYWIGGEGALIGIALVMPILFSIGGLFSREFEDRAPRDPVTELPLRAEIVAAASSVLDDGPTARGSTAALTVGIDEFRDIVERYGTSGGEALLMACANRIEDTFRSGDLLGRLDGPRFVVLLQPGARCDLEGLIHISSRLQKIIQEPFSLSGTRVFLNVSVGFAASRKVANVTGETLIAAAEQALDEAMSSGTGVIRAYRAELHKTAPSRGSMADELPRAVEEGEIRPWYQPQIRTGTGEITGFEVLARWEHREWGLVPPGEFLPAAEQLGLLGRLGEVIMFQTLNNMRAWDATGVRVPKVSINFAAEELRDPAIVERIKFDLDRFDIAPDRLCVEVLETVIAQTTNDTIIRNLRAFADMGCTIDLDDFGTGHASIANIKRFAVSRIKIDRSFVTQIDSDLEQQNIVSAILTLARRLDIATLAEGVETAAEQGILRKLGCDYLQGYGISRPMPFHDVEDWIAAYQAAAGDAGPARDAPAAVNVSSHFPLADERGKTA